MLQQMGIEVTCEIFGLSSYLSQMRQQCSRRVRALNSVAKVCCRSSQRQTLKSSCLRNRCCSVCVAVYCSVCVLLLFVKSMLE